MGDDSNSHGGDGRSGLGKVQDAIGAAVGMASASTLGSHSAHAFLQNAAASNLYEIEAARIAQTRAASPEVREVAQDMIRDHQMLATKTRHAVSEIGGVEPAEETLDNRRQGMLDNLRDAPAEGFDRAYLEQQQTAHREAVTLFKGYAESGDNPQLKGLAASAIPILQKHLDRVTSLLGH